MQAGTEIAQKTLETVQYVLAGHFSALQGILQLTFYVGHIQSLWLPIL